MAFQMTADAAREVLEAAVRSSAQGMALRVAAKPTPEGIALGIGFDDEAEEDEVAVFHGLTVLIAPESRALLADAVLDFRDAGDGTRGFTLVEAESCATAQGGCSTGGCSRCG